MGLARNIRIGGEIYEVTVGQHLVRYNSALVYNVFWNWKSTEIQPV